MEPQNIIDLYNEGDIAYLDKISLLTLLLGVNLITFNFNVI